MINGKEVRICVLPRGWVYVGLYDTNGEMAWIEKGYNIRRWGTSKGLGQLAIEGPLIETVLDPVLRTEWHIESSHTILCDSEKWRKYFA